MTKNNRPNFYLIAVSILIFCCSCDSISNSTLYNPWGLEWEFLNITDSILVEEPLQYLIINKHVPKGYDIIEDTTSSEGILSEWILFPGTKDDFLNKNPELHFKLFHENRIICDTMFYWSELELIDRTNFQSIYVNYR